MTSVRLLSERLGDRHNGLNLLRLILASAVIVGHAFPLTGSGPSRWESVSGTAVDGFFVVSGYLIAASRDRLTFLPYLWRRCLRIFPAYWTVLVLTAFVLAPWAATVERTHYDVAGALAYAAGNADLVIHQWGVGTTLSTVPFAGVWNGSLWTLRFEFLAYLAVGALLTIRWGRWKPAVLIAALVAVIVARHLALGPLDVTTNFHLHALRLAGYFLVGSVFWSLSDRWCPRPWQGFAAAAVYGLLWAAELQSLWGHVPLAVALLVFGSRRTTGWTTTTDLSYGVYVYAFPVQQILVLFGSAALGVVVNSALTLAITVPVAYASWRLVEKPALRLERPGFAASHNTNGGTGQSPPRRS